VDTVVWWQVTGQDRQRQRPGQADFTGLPPMLTEQPPPLRCLRQKDGNRAGQGSTLCARHRRSA
jgi:hypothetical protein